MWLSLRYKWNLTTPACGLLLSTLIFGKVASLKGPVAIHKQGLLGSGDALRNQQDISTSDYGFPLGTLLTLEGLEQTLQNNKVTNSNT